MSVLGGLVADVAEERVAHEAAHHAGKVKRRTAGTGSFKGTASAPSATASAAATAAVGVSVASAASSTSSALGGIRRGRRNAVTTVVVIFFVVAFRGRDFRWVGEWLALLHGFGGRRRFIVLFARGFTLSGSLSGSIHAGILREGMFVVARRAVEVVVEPVSPSRGSLIPPGAGPGSGRWRRRWMRPVRLMRLVWRVAAVWRRRSSEGETGEAGEGTGR